MPHKYICVRVCVCVCVCVCIHIVLHLDLQMGTRNFKEKITLPV